MSEDTRAAFAILGAIGATLLLVFTDGFFTGFAAYIYNYFWFTLIALILVTPAYMYLFLLGTEILVPSETYHGPSLDAIKLSMSTFIPFNFFCMLIAAGYGNYVVNALDHTRPELGNHLMGVFFIPYGIGLYPYIAIWVAIILFTGFSVIVGFVAIFQQHPATKVANRSLTKRPDDEVERELASVMKRQDIEDDIVWQLFDELSALKKSVWITKLKIRGFKARQLREAVIAHTDTLITETDLALRVHEKERIKRSIDPLEDALNTETEEPLPVRKHERIKNSPDDGD